MPQLGRRGERLAVIPGVPPMPWAMPRGCRFHPRCPYRVEQCQSGDAPLQRLEADRSSRCLRTGELALRGTP
jgi:peptide/nickel transport system ATP-binding protein